MQETRGTEHDVTGNKAKPWTPPILQTMSIASTQSGLNVVRPEGTIPGVFGS